MIKVGSIIQSEYTHNGKKGNIGIVLKIAEPYPVGFGARKVVARVFYPKTRTSGWVKIEDMKLIA